VWTQDNHESFSVPGHACFEIIKSNAETEVISYSAESCSGASIEQHVILPSGERRIDIDNVLKHVSGLYNKDRYKRYAYYAFPFVVSNARRICHLNGCLAEYGTDLTGHSTDVYMAASDWVCASNNEYSVGVIQFDSQLVEFDHIHPDKTDYGMPGKGSAMFFYLANDWLQMHSPGGSHMDMRFRYSITTFTGGHKGLDALADRLTHPVLTCSIPVQNGVLSGKSMSFIKAMERILVLKPASDGNGLILRLYGNRPDHIELNNNVFGNASTESCTIDERPKSETPVFGFFTYRLTGKRINLKTVEYKEPHGLGAAHTPIGSKYTRLISDLCAARGEDYGHIYVLWGAVCEDDLAGYNVYRSEYECFTADENSLVAFVKPEEYCVGRYVDKGLKHHSKYYYRVCAVDKNGHMGPLSREVSAWTKE